MNQHLTFAAGSAEGKGVDRHLFGLKRLIKEGEPMPAMFKDPAFGNSSNWVMSTSSLASDMVRILLASIRLLVTLFLMMFLSFTAH